MQRRKIPSLITTRCAGWHRAGGIHPRRRANCRPDNRDLDHPCRPRRRHQMEGPGTASNAAPALATLRALRQDGSRPRSQKQDLSGSRKSGSQWTRRRRKADLNWWSHLVRRVVPRPQMRRCAQRAHHVHRWVIPQLFNQHTVCRVRNRGSRDRIRRANHCGSSFPVVSGSPSAR